MAAVVATVTYVGGGSATKASRVQQKSVVVGSVARHQRNGMTLHISRALLLLRSRLSLDAQRWRWLPRG